MADKRLIAALDVHTMAEVKELVETLGDTVSYYKVGMELFYGVGESVIAYLNAQHKDIFLDLKLHDIPNTVAEGLCSLLHLGGIKMLNVHAAGGYTMMRTAVERLHEEAARLKLDSPKLLAVTILTSIDDAEWKELGNTSAVQDQVVHLARLAQKAGLDGVVASPKEAGAIRQACGRDFLIVTPGIRPLHASQDDQSRIAQPSTALKNGATHLVIGRPIRMAENPRQAAEAIIKEMEIVQL